MATLFDKILTDVKEVELKVLGPDYNYVKQIRMPSELGMSDKGDLDTLARDVGGLIAYVQLLASGDSPASKTGRPLGNKFFLETGAKCKDVDTGREVTRSLYVNNVPGGHIPFLSGAMGGVDIKEFRGLVPGVISNLDTINPLKIFQAFLGGSMPACRSILMETINEENRSSMNRGYVTDVDIKGMDPCWFGGVSLESSDVNRASKNPITGDFCKMEGFENPKEKKNTKTDCSKMPDDPYVKLYYSALGVFGLYILMLVFSRKR